MSCSRIICLRVGRYRLPAVAALILVFTAVLSSPSQGKPAINTTAEDLAISGYDTVAYFVDGEAKPGSPDLAIRWQDAVWYFSSAENRALFAADPSRYAPQFGGWCAAGIAKGARYTADPEAWAIVDGKLYLNYSHRIREEWAENAEENIEKAEKHWAAQEKE